MVKIYINVLYSH